MSALNSSKCLVLAGWLLLTFSSVNAAEPVIPLTDDFTPVATRSEKNSLPIVVFVSRDGCPYCRTLRDSVLAPMYTAGKFNQRALLIEVNLDGPDPLRGFDGQAVTIKHFTEKYKAGITPTLLFLDQDGQQLSPARVGISNIDLYVYYLNQAIDEALDKLNRTQ